MSTHPKSAPIASKMLADYEVLNSDLPERVRQQLGMFVIAPKVGMKAMHELFERDLGQTLNRHRAWMWWTAMSYSGLSEYWGEFSAAYNLGLPVRDCLRALKGVVNEADWSLFSRRMGVKSLRPAAYSRVGTTNLIWTKGGTWDRRKNMTKIVVLGEHLKGRDLNYNGTTRRLDLDRCQLIETELYQLIDHNALLTPTAMFDAVDYVRHRIPSLIDSPRATTSPKVAAWFFMEPVPYQHGLMAEDRQWGYPRPSQGSVAWLP